MAPTKTVVYSYSGCGTCKKALKWLEGKGVPLDVRPIVDAPPSAKELAELIAKSGVPASKWFNTSGLSYRALVQEKGKDAVAALTEAQIVKLLAADGKLIKRPVVIAGAKVLVGFKEPAYDAVFG